MWEHLRFSTPPGKEGITTTARLKAARYTRKFGASFDNDNDNDIYLTAIGCIPGGSGTRLQTKVTYNNNNQHHNTSSKPFTLLWAEVRVRTVPRH